MSKSSTLDCGRWPEDASPEVRKSVTERQKIRDAIGLFACELQHWVLNCEDLDYKFTLAKADDFSNALDDLAEFAKDTQKKIRKPLSKLNEQDFIVPVR